MTHFFVDPADVAGDELVIRGGDVNHIKNVLRMKPGEEFFASDGQGNDYYCAYGGADDGEARARVLYVRPSESELPVNVTLYQGLPKGDKMELIIQKCTELGVKRIVPVNCARCVAKLDEKKAPARIKRWQDIAEAAAKQSGRGVIPVVSMPMSFKAALAQAKSASVRLFPYECAQGMERTRELFSKIRSGDDIAVFIGPEGGFEVSEADTASQNGFEAVTLGKRILRTETAGMYVLSVIGFNMEA
ncbi:MAG: 16S rRNA (uracil(1498)-N(3))-methyltransferase [Lachnospiraceae bacterium]|nr:16S rRNA (uracil(1498)-N(3))-methyltransferase [Lachnospiraceae bacterium]